jgi:hypothetical protein
VLGGSFCQSIPVSPLDDHLKKRLRGSHSHHQQTHCLVREEILASLSEDV